MIEKILDKYFAKKAIYLLWDKLRYSLYISGQIRKDKTSYQLFIKKPKHKDEYYKIFWAVPFESGLELYMNIHDVVNDKKLQEDALRKLKEEADEE